MNDIIFMTMMMKKMIKKKNEKYQKDITEDEQRLQQQ